MIKLLKYDFIYLWRTYKFLIFPAVAVLFAFVSPLTAKYINELLALLTSTTGGDPLITLPDPTILDSYGQYVSNLYEIFLIVGIFVSVSIFMRDKNKGLLPLILSKPINRTKYLLSKFISLSILILVSLMLGYFVFSYYTFFVFDKVDMLGMFLVSILFFVYVIFILAISLFSAVFFNSYLVAVSTTFAIYIITSMLTIFEVSIFKYLPGVISSNSVNILIGEEIILDVILNVGVTLLISFVFIYFAVNRFKKQNI